jgi:hypothetical protein
MVCVLALRDARIGMKVCVCAARSAAVDPVTSEFILALNEFVPPLDAVPLTTRNALSLCVVDFVQPVGAAVCANSIAVPDGIMLMLPSITSVLPLPICKPTLVPVPSAAKIASIASMSALSFVPHVVDDAPTSGLSSVRFVVNVSAIMKPC